MWQPKIKLNAGQFVLIICLIIGIFLRFINIDKKVYWYDETFTSLRISGYQESEIVENLGKSRIFNRDEVLQYQQLNPARNVIDTIKSLAQEDPQHPPLYYVINHFWSRCFGTSITAMRILPLLFGLLLLPAIYFLCIELFGSSSVGLTAMALIAVSPFHFLYALEARQYSLWSLMIVLSTTALLRALRQKTRISWLIYSLALTGNLYTFLFSGLVAIGQGIYVLMIEKFRITRNVIAYFFASLVSLIIFSPWIWVVINSVDQVNKVTSFTGGTRSNLFRYARGVLTQISRVFVDFNISPDTPKIYLLLQISLILLVLITVIYALYFVYHETPKRSWLLIFTLIGSIIIPLILPDLILGGTRLTMARYIIPIFLGIHLAVAYLFTIQSQRQNKLGKMITAIIITAGILSCVAISQTEFWWNKDLDGGNPHIARLINNYDNPLVISDQDVADILSLSHYLKPDTKLLLKPECYTCNLVENDDNILSIPVIPPGFNNVFLYNPRADKMWLKALNQDQNYHVETLSQSKDFWLWKITPK